MMRPAKHPKLTLTTCTLFALACKGDSRGSDTASSTPTVTFTNDAPFDYDARVFVADEDSSGLFLCFAAKETGFAPGMPVTVGFGDTVTLAIERGKPPIRFRVCAGTEGLNASAWAGIPLASPRKWHGYYYLGYDVDPSCKEGEYAPDSSVKSGGGR